MNATYKPAVLESEKIGDALTTGIVRVELIYDDRKTRAYSVRVYWPTDYPDVLWFKDEESARDAYGHQVRHLRSTWKFKSPSRQSERQSPALRMPVIEEIEMVTYVDIQLLAIEAQRRTINLQSWIVSLIAGEEPPGSPKPTMQWSEIIHLTRANMSDILDDLQNALLVYEKQELNDHHNEIVAPKAGNCLCDHCKIADRDQDIEAPDPIPDDEERAGDTEYSAIQREGVEL